MKKNNLVTGIMLVAVIFMSSLDIIRAEAAETEVEMRSESELKNRDLNGDGVVNYADLRILYSHWGKCEDSCRGNINGDQKIDKEDMRLMLHFWTEVKSEEIAKISDRCNAIEDPKEQRICFIRLTQDAEVEFKKNRAMSEMNERLPNEKEKTVKERLIGNYMRHMSNMLLKMSAAIARLERLAYRIESRIEKFEAAGADLGDSKELLAGARIKIEAAETEVENISLTYEDLPLKDKPKEYLAEIRTTVKEAKEKIKGAHSALVEVVASIKVGISNNN